MANNGGTPAHPGRSYWWDEDAVVKILSALRTFRHADQEMRRRVSADMDMNATDLQALQIVIAGEREGTPVSPRDLARRLHISTASTTKLLDRLTASGHLVRTPHPTDRRSIVVHATDHAHAEVRERLTSMHDAMLELAREVPEDAREHLVRFLLGMAELLDRQAAPEPLRPRGGA